LFRFVHFRVIWQSCYAVISKYVAPDRRPFCKDKREKRRRAGFAKKQGGGGKFTWGSVEDVGKMAAEPPIFAIDERDPNFQGCVFVEFFLLRIRSIPSIAFVDERGASPANTATTRQEDQCTEEQRKQLHQALPISSSVGTTEFNPSLAAATVPTRQVQEHDSQQRNINVADSGEGEWELVRHKKDRYPGDEDEYDEDAEYNEEGALDEEGAYDENGAYEEGAYDEDGFEDATDAQYFEDALEEQYDLESTTEQLKEEQRAQQQLTHNVKTVVDPVSSKKMQVGEPSIPSRRSSFSGEASQFA